MKAEVYKSILDAIAANPKEPVSSLCRAKGVSYQSFNNWRRRNEAGHVYVPFSLSQLADLYLAGTSVVEVSVKDVVSKLDPRDKQSFATLVGMARLESDLTKS